MPRDEPAEEQLASQIGELVRQSLSKHHADQPAIDQLGLNQDREAAVDRLVRELCFEPSSPQSDEVLRLEAAPRVEGVEAVERQIERLQVLAGRLDSLLSVDMEYVRDACQRASMDDLIGWDTFALPTFRWYHSLYRLVQSGVGPCLVDHRSKVLELMEADPDVMMTSLTTHNTEVRCAEVTLVEAIVSCEKHRRAAEGKVPGDVMVVQVNLTNGLGGEYCYSPRRCGQAIQNLGDDYLDLSEVDLLGMVWANPRLDVQPAVVCTYEHHSRLRHHRIERGGCKFLVSLSEPQRRFALEINRGKVTEHSVSHNSLKDGLSGRGAVAVARIL